MRIRTIDHPGIRAQGELLHQLAGEVRRAHRGLREVLGERVRTRTAATQAGLDRARAAASGDAAARWSQRERLAALLAEVAAAEAEAR